MAKVGRFVVDPKAGAYCQITLDSGEKIVVNHDKGGFKGGHLTIEVPKFLGLSSERIFSCDLDAGEGPEVREIARRAREDADLIALAQAGVDEVAAEEPGRAGDERPHATLRSRVGALGAAGRLGRSVFHQVAP